MKNIVLFLLALLMSCHVMAQQTVVTGSITDATDGSPLIGTNVLVKGTGNGTITNAEGKFSVSVPAGKKLVIVSCIGYRTEEITLKPSQKVLNVEMKEDTELLDEVVVVGYGTMKKSDLTGAVTSIKSDELMKSNPASLNQGLQGRIAGVQVNQNDGAPGAGVSIQIRGANSFSTSTEPLYVVDGIPFTTSGMPGTGRDGMLQTANPLSSINPSDIESIEILKDASATAIYGSRGANGVVLITTKRGAQGKDNITFNANFGFSNVVKKIEMLDAYHYTKYQNEGVRMFNEYENSRTPLPYPGTFKIDSTTGESIYAPGPDDYLTGEYPNINWQDQVFETAFSQEYNLSVNGANDKGYYSISGNILDQTGIINNSGYSRYSFRANVARKVHEWIEIGTSMSFSNSLNKLAKTNTVSDGIIKGALFYPSNSPLNDESNNTQLNWFSSNPYVYTRAAKDELTTNNFFSSSFLELTLIKDLKLRQNVGYSYNTNVRDVFYDRRTVEGKDVNGYASKADNWSQNLVLETMATYNKEFNKNHALNVVAAFSYEKGNYGNKAMTAKGFPHDLTLDHDMGAALNPGKPTSGRGMTSLVSFLGRANYNLLSKYLFTVSFRRDGSSKFAPGNKWSNFASAAIAWRASEEEFIKRLDVFSNLKVRASYGQTGNQAIGAYATRDYLTIANYPINGVLSSGFANLTWRGPANPDLKWETTSQYNVGIDMGFFENKINLTVDLYYKKTEDLLQNIQIPQSTGFSNMTTNFGNVTNKGLEIAGKFYAITNRDFKWDFDANLSFNRNKISGLRGDQFAQALWSDADDAFLQRNGMPIGTIFGFVEDGFYDNMAEVRANPFYAKESDAICKAMIGEVKYKDFDGVAGITDADRQVIGDTNPDFTVGMTHNFKYKNFSLSFFLQGCVGGDIFNGNLMEVTMDGIGNIPVDVYETRWTPDHRENAKWAKAYGGYGRTQRISNHYVEDGSYLRMKNINLGYMLKSPFKGIESINVYAAVNNAFTISGYSWYDPDVNSFGSDSSRRGVDMFSYPSSRTFSFGLQCVF